jgi:hypothetical protein
MPGERMETIVRSIEILYTSHKASISSQSLCLCLETRLRFLDNIGSALVWNRSCRLLCQNSVDSYDSDWYQTFSYNCQCSQHTCKGSDDVARLDIPLGEQFQKGFESILWLCKRILWVVGPGLIARDKREASGVSGRRHDPSKCRSRT